MPMIQKRLCHARLRSHRGSSLGRLGGFRPTAAGAILDCESDFVITADQGVRGGRPIPLKENTDKAIAIAEKSGAKVRHVLVVRRTGAPIDWVTGRDLWYHDEVAIANTHCKPEEMNAEDPLFILYTSGSTGKPKGVLHTTGGYLVRGHDTPVCVRLPRGRNLLVHG